MSKIILKDVNLSNFSSFIGALTPLNEASTVYFTIDKDGVRTDSHNDSGTIIKSVNVPLSEICESSNLDKVEGGVRVCFYDGKKVLKAFGFLGDSKVNCEFKFAELEGENYAQSCKIASAKMNLSIDAADPSLIEFANVPEDAIENVKDVSGADCNFKLNSEELSQIQKLCDFDTNSEITFYVNGSVKVGTEDSFEISVDEDFEGNEGNATNYNIDRELFKLIDSDNYQVYPNMDDFKITFKAESGRMDVVVTLHEDV